MRGTTRWAWRSIFGRLRRVGIGELNAALPLPSRRSFTVNALLRGVLALDDRAADVLWKVESPQLDGPGLAVLARWVAGLLLAAAGVRFFAKRSSRHRSALPAIGTDELPESNR